MKKFRFRLEKILQLKAHEEKEKQKILALATQQVVGQEKELSDIHRNRDKNINNQRQYLTGSINLHHMTMFSRYYLQLKKNELTGRQLLKVYQKDEDNKREALVEATRAKKVYEKLKERLREAHDKEIKLLQQKEQDELAGRMIQHEKSSRARREQLNNIG